MADGVVATKTGSWIGSTTASATGEASKAISETDASCTLFK